MSWGREEERKRGRDGGRERQGGKGREGKAAVSWKGGFNYTEMNMLVTTASYIARMQTVKKC